jgi:hypothetical protein
VNDCGELFLAEAFEDRSAFGECVDALSPARSSHVHQAELPEKLCAMGREFRRRRSEKLFDLLAGFVDAPE